MAKIGVYQVEAEGADTTPVHVIVDSGSSSLAAIATAAAPTYIEGSSNALSTNLAGALRVIDAGPAPSTPLYTTISDVSGLQTATVKAGATQAVSGDSPLVIIQHPLSLAQIAGVDEAAALTAIASGALGADAKAWTTKNVALVAALGMDFNGTGFDRRRNTLGLTGLSSTSRTVNAGTGNVTNYNHRGIVVFINVTVNASSLGSISPVIRGVDNFSGVAYDILVGPAAIIAPGLYVMRVYPGIAETATFAKSDILPRTFQLNTIANNANPMTYSVAYTLVL